MTYTDKLNAITESLTDDRTLSDLAARLESNRRQRAIDEAVNGVDFAKIELSTCQKDSDVSVMISDIESAISVLNCSLILLNTIVETDKLVETLVRCAGKEINL